MAASMVKTSRIFSWGANSYGQLSNGHFDDILEPKDTKTSRKDDSAIVSIVGGGGHTVFVTDDRKLKTSGWNLKGQLGHAHSCADVKQCSLPRPLECEELDGARISSVSCGWDSTYIVSEAGLLYSFGSNSFGQLGNHSAKIMKIFTNKPTLVNIQHDQSTTHVKIKDVAAGLRHVLALTTDGEVFSWGAANKGQLGTGLSKAPRHEPVRVDLPLDTEETVAGIVAGAYHSGCWTNTGKVILWGQNKHGQTTIDPVNNSDIIEFPHTVEKDVFGGHNIVQVKSGWTHLLAVSDTGELFSWGRNDYGQLGRKSKNPLFDSRPKKIMNLPKFQDICCGSEHNLLLSSDGVVLAWGWNEHGICGTGDEEDVQEPRPIEALKGLQITVIGCGMGHSFAYTKA